MNTDTTTLTTEDGTKYITEAIPKTFPIINLMPGAAELKPTVMLCCAGVSIKQCIFLKNPHTAME
jgi:hypothetical protein